MTRVGCAPPGTALPRGIDLPITLYAHRQTSQFGEVGALVPAAVSSLGLRPNARAWDFLSIALATVAADEACPRHVSADGWTRQISVLIAVVDPTFWAGQASALQEALRFVTGDIWSLSFMDGGFLPASPARPPARTENAVCLLSGGMDSLIGAIDLVSAGQSPLLVSQVAKGDKKQQRQFASIIAPSSLHVQLNHTASPPGPSERSQRARSLAFLGFGVLAATSLDSYGATSPVTVFVPENGFISMNIPLTPLRIGSLSTRTTHPAYLSKIQEILDTAGLHVKLHNPYQVMTKGEMLVNCKNQPLLKSLAGATTSCGRYARSGFKQCGRCVPCLIRRASFQKGGISDSTPAYRYAALGTAGHQYQDFDDVRAVAFAVHTVRTRGLHAWIGGALNSAQIGLVGSIESMIGRGIGELENFLRTQGVL